MLVIIFAIMKHFRSVLISAILYTTLLLATYFRITCAQLIYEEDLDLRVGSDCKTEKNLTGVCTKASHCSKIKLEISSTKICSFDGIEAIVCCVRTSQLVCHNFQIFNGKLGLIPEKHHFIGGIRAQPRQYPHMAAIGWSNDIDGVSWKCGASLISDNFVLTAAHCSTSRGVAPDIVRAGVVNLVKEDPTGRPPVDFAIESIIVHPEYKAPSTYHDIALFRIKPTIDLDDLKPICLWPIKEIIGTDLLGMGFGTTSFGGPQANELFVGTLNYVSQNQCQVAFATRQSEELKNGIIDSQMCAKDRENKRDTCQGDSGGPLQLKGDATWYRKNYLVGITSFGEGCLGPVPGVYTRIHSYLEWIERIVWPDFF